MASCPCGEPIGGPPCTFEHPCPYGEGHLKERWAPLTVVPPEGLTVLARAERMPRIAWCELEPIEGDPVEHPPVNAWVLRDEDSLTYRGKVFPGGTEFCGHCYRALWFALAGQDRWHPSVGWRHSRREKERRLG